MKTRLYKKVILHHHIMYQPENQYLILLFYLEQKCASLTLAANYLDSAAFVPRAKLRIEFHYIGHSKECPI